LPKELALAMLPTACVTMVIAEPWRFARHSTSLRPVSPSCWKQSPTHESAPRWLVPAFARMSVGFLASSAAASGRCSTRLCNMGLPQLLRLAVVAKAAKRRGSSQLLHAVRPLSLAKELRRLAVATRKQEAELIKARRVTLDGKVIQDPKAILPGGAALAVDGVLLDRDPPLLLKYHKPVHVICSMKDHQGRVDLSDVVPGLVSPWHPSGQGGGSIAGVDPWVAISKYHPVGRLDRDTTGLLLFSCHGKLTQRLLSPAREVPRRYAAVVDGDVTRPAKGSAGLAEKLRHGVRTSDGIFTAEVLELGLLPTGAHPGRLGPRSQVVLEVAEGKYHMVRKLLYNCGFPVLELHRTRYGALELGDQPVGTVVRATEEEAQWATQVAEGRKKGQP